MNNQLTHNEYQHEKNKFPIKIILDNVDDGINVGSIFRLADGFGVSEICLCGSTPSVENKTFKKTSRSTQNYVEHSQYEKTIDCINKLKEEEYKIIAIEITSNSSSLQNYNFVNEKVAIVLGNEKHGVSEEILNVVDDTLHVDMYGNNSSFNVATVTGIVLYEIVRQKIGGLNGKSRNNK